MRRWSTTGAAGVLRDLIVPILRDVLTPAAGIYGALTDRPLTEWAAGLYAAMMGIPFAAWVDRRRSGKSGAEDPTDTYPPSPTPPGLT